MNKDFMIALDQIQNEKGIERESILEALERALEKSYEKNFDNNDNVEVQIDRENGAMTIFSIRKVVENVEDKINEISLDQARTINANYQIDDIVKVEVEAKDFGRIAAQTAKNVVVQQIKDIERNLIYGEFIDRERELINGVIQRIENGYLCIDLGKLEGVVPPKEQIPGESYEIGDRKKFFICEVKNTTKGAQIVLSRTNPGLVVRLFELEIPEIDDGIVQIFAITREAGSRTKIAVFSTEEDVDPLGACVGFQGARVKEITSEIDNEKIDIIVYDKDPKVFIANALSPANVIDVHTKEDLKAAIAVVPDDQLSLAIGKEGQNARLAARLTNWKIDIKGQKAFNEFVETGEFNLFLNEGREPVLEDDSKVDLRDESEDKSSDLALDDLNKDLGSVEEAELNFENGNIGSQEEHILDDMGNLGEY